MGTKGKGKGKGFGPRPAPRSLPVDDEGKTKQVFLGNLGFKVTNEDLVEGLSAAGKVVEASVFYYYDGNKQKSRGCATVEFETHAEVLTAIEMFDKKEFHGRPLYVSEDLKEGKPASGSG